MKKIREEAGKEFTQAWVGKEMGTDGNMVSRWERGDVDPKEATARLFGYVMDLSIEATMAAFKKLPYTGPLRPSRPRRDLPLDLQNIALRAGLDPVEFLEKFAAWFEQCQPHEQRSLLDAISAGSDVRGLHRSKSDRLTEIKT